MPPFSGCGWTWVSCSVTCGDRDCLMECTMAWLGGVWLASHRRCVIGASSTTALAPSRNACMRRKLGTSVKNVGPQWHRKWCSATWFSGWSCRTSDGFANVQLTSRTSLGDERPLPALLRTFGVSFRRDERGRAWTVNLWVKKQRSCNGLPLNCRCLRFLSGSKSIACGVCLGCRSATPLRPAAWGSQPGWCRRCPLQAVQECPAFGVCRGGVFCLCSVKNVIFKEDLVLETRMSCHIQHRPEKERHQQHRKERRGKKSYKLRTDRLTGDREGLSLTLERSVDWKCPF